MVFEDLFRSGDSARDNFRSRAFGLFSETIVLDWTANPKSRYANLGRPTLWSPPGFATLDFTLEDLEGRRFVAEQKAELAFEGHRYLRLDRPADGVKSQIDHHRGGRAFRWFLEMAADSESRLVKVGGKQTPVDGAILIWGATTPRGRTAAMEAYGFADVLSLEDMLRDLREWGDAAWRARVATIRDWTDGLLDGLTW